MGDHAGAIERLVTERIPSVRKEVAGGDVDAESDLLAQDEPGSLDRGDGVVQHRLCVREVRGETALVSDQWAGAVALSAVGGGRRRRRPRRQTCLVGGGGGYGHDQHILDGDLSAGMLAATEEVYGRAGQPGGRWRGSLSLFTQYLSEAFVEGLTPIDGDGPGEGQRGGQESVRAEVRLVRGAVQLQQSGVEGGLSGKDAVTQGGKQDVGNVGGGSAAAQATVASRIAIAQLVGLGGAGRRPGWDGDTGGCSPGQRATRPEGGPPPAIQDFMGEKALDCGHPTSNCVRHSASRWRVALQSSS